MGENEGVAQAVIDWRDDRTFDRSDIRSNHEKLSGQWFRIRNKAPTCQALLQPFYPVKTGKQFTN